MIKFENLRKTTLNEMDSRQYALIKAGLVAPTQLTNLKVALSSLNKHGDMRKLNKNQQTLILQYMNNLTSAVVDDNSSYSTTRRSAAHLGESSLHEPDPHMYPGKVTWINDFFKHVHTLSHGKFGGDGQEIDLQDVAHIMDHTDAHKAAEYFIRRKLNESKTELNESTAPAILTLRRTGIRTFPDGHEVVMYHNEALGLVFAVPMNKNGSSPNGGNVISGQPTK